MQHKTMQIHFNINKGFIMHQWFGTHESACEIAYLCHYALLFTNMCNYHTDV